MTRRVVLFAVASVALLGCPPEQIPADQIELRFAGRVGDAPFVCGQTYAGVGTSASTLTALDFRFYVSEVVLLAADGAEVPVALTAAAPFSSPAIALLDFEDGSAGCDSGNAPMNDVVRGSVASGRGPFVGVRFTLGVPERMNHLDTASAGAPLDFTSMFWSWQAGYKHLRVDARSTGQPAGLRVHLGSTDCSGDAFMGTRTCARGNRPVVELRGFDPTTGTIVADLAALFAGTDLDADLGGPPGCMSDVTDPDCDAVFGALGLPFGARPATAQTFFRAEGAGP